MTGIDHPTVCDNATQLPGDCNDVDASIHPGASERCNGVDDDCDGYITLELDERDMDGDGQLVCEGCPSDLRCGIS